MTAPVSNRLIGTTGATSVATLTGFSFSGGDTMLVMLVTPTANGEVTLFTDNATPPNVYELDNYPTSTYNGLAWRFYRKSNLVNIPTTLSATATTGSFAGQFFVVQVSSLDSAPFVSSIARTILDGTYAPTLTPITTSNAHDFVFLGFSTSNLRTVNSATGGVEIVPPEVSTSYIHSLYLADAGPAGLKTGLTLSCSGSAAQHMAGVIYKSVPTLPSLTIGDVTVNRTDGTASAPVTLSSPAPVGGVTVNYATHYDTATAPAYYIAASGTLTFAEGETTKNVTVSITP